MHPRSTPKWLQTTGFYDYPPRGWPMGGGFEHLDSIFLRANKIPIPAALPKGESWQAECSIGAVLGREGGGRASNLGGL